MADNTRMATMAAEIRAHNAELKRVMDLLELCDQEQRAHTAQVEAAANARMERIQSMVESPLQNQAQLHGGSSMNSTQTHTFYGRNISLPSLSKCSFGATNIDYLGHTISNAGIAMEEDKIRRCEGLAKTNISQVIERLLRPHEATIDGLSGITPLWQPR
ncbi:hypothetical protein ACSQ67_009010 [Phaseolus vulgaris]